MDIDQLAQATCLRQEFAWRYSVQADGRLLPIPI